MPTSERSNDTVSLMLIERPDGPFFPAMRHDGKSPGNLQLARFDGCGVTLQRASATSVLCSSPTARQRPVRCWPKANSDSLPGQRLITLFVLIAEPQRRTPGVTCPSLLDPMRQVANTLNNLVGDSYCHFCKCHAPGTLLPFDKSPCSQLDIDSERTAYSSSHARSRWTAQSSRTFNG